MKLDDLEQVTMLRNHRRLATELMAAAKSGTLNFEIWYGGEKFDPFSVIPADPVRAAVVGACDRFIVEKEHELADLGVTLPSGDCGT